MARPQTVTFLSNLILNIYEIEGDESTYERLHEGLLEFQSKRQAEVFWGEVIAVARKHGVLIEPKVE